MEEFVILVDENDAEIGKAKKLGAHQKGLLHRAFSIFIFNSSGEMLLQQRALGKYHSGGLWTNACCGHPRPGETILNAAKRRLMEEMGITCELESKYAFTYKANLDNNLIEHEVDHVLIGKFDGEFLFNSAEVSNFKWMGIEELKDDIAKSPQDFTVWFRMSLEEILAIYP